MTSKRKVTEKLKPNYNSTSARTKSYRKPVILTNEVKEEVEMEVIFPQITLKGI